MSERFEIKNFKEAISIIKDKSLEKIAKEFSKDFSHEFKFQGIFLSKKEISKEIKERLASGINDEYKDVKSKISHLRKKGLNVNIIDFNFLRIPLKIKVLMTEFNLKNYQNILKIFTDTKKELEEFKDIE